MIDRIGRPGARLAVPILVFLALSLLAWNSLPKSVAGDAPENSPTTKAAIPQDSMAEDVKRGQELFMGNAHFENEGPPCMGCHSIGNNGILGGGALGPDLTNVSTRRSQSELQTILSNSSTANVPVMQPIYGEHPLTATEQADLLAFINASVGQPETNREGWVIGISLVGFFACIGLIELVYHRRLRGVRKPMVRQARSTK